MLTCNLCTLKHIPETDFRKSRMSPDTLSKSLPTTTITYTNMHVGNYCLHPLLGVMCFPHLLSCVFPDCSLPGVDSWHHRVQLGVVQAVLSCLPHLNVCQPLLYHIKLTWWKWNIHYYANMTAPTDHHYTYFLSIPHISQVGKWISLQVHTHIETKNEGCCFAY